MESLSFIRSTVVALLLSIAAVVVYFSMNVFFVESMAVRITISSVSFGYIAYLLSNAKVSFGKLSSITLFGVCTIALLYLWPSLIEFALFNVGFIWLVRSVYYHTHVVTALVDLLFSMLAFTAAIGAVIQSQNIFMSFWCFFLTQALIIPVLNYLIKKYSDKSARQSSGQANSSTLPLKEPVRDFGQAHRNAEDALRKLVKTSYL